MAISLVIVSYKLLLYPKQNIENEYKMFKYLLFVALCWRSISFKSFHHLNKSLERLFEENKKLNKIKDYSMNVQPDLHSTYNFY